MKSPAYNWLLTLGVCAAFLWFGLLIRMIASVIEALPPEKRFPLMEYRSRYPEVLHLHRELFPKSALRLAWRLLGIASVLLVAGAIALYHQWLPGAWRAAPDALGGR